METRKNNEPYVLSKVEYDILASVNFIDISLGDCVFTRQLMRKGYFKNIDPNTFIKDILDNYLIMEVDLNGDKK